MVAFGDENPRQHRVTLGIDGDLKPIEQWDRFYKEGAWCATVPVTPGPERRTVQLFVDDKLTDSAEVAALPSRLGPDPWRVVLGSCFEPTRLGRERLKRTLDGLEGPRPAVKLLCGDQVYLDPMPPPLTREWWKGTPQARTAFIYRRTWTHPGFGALLKSGMNVFCPDDHDLWNDYTIEDGEKQKPREDAAKRAIKMFQCVAPLQQFAVPPLRFMVVDTRQQRTLPDSKPPEFMAERKLDDVVTWIGEGTGPGVLVLGQPIFGERGYHGKFGPDIPMYTHQFNRLAKALLNAPSSILVLSGDVHWGRVALARNRRGKSLIEVISSPLGIKPARAASIIARPCRDALPEFSDGSAACAVETIEASKVTSAHFATLDFRAESDAPSGVSVEIRQRLLRPGAAARPAFKYDL